MSETERSGKNKRAKHWTAAEAREVLTRWKESGQSAAVFALQHGVSPSRLSYWSKQLRSLVDDRSPQFVAVSVPVSTSVEHTVEIAVNGLTVFVREGADAGFVAQLVSALQHRSAPSC